MKWSDRLQGFVAILAAVFYFSTDYHMSVVLFLFILFIGFVWGESRSFQSVVEGLSLVICVLTYFLVKDAWIVGIAVVITSGISVFVNFGDFLQNLSKKK